MSAQSERDRIRSESKSSSSATVELIDLRELAAGSLAQTNLQLFEHRW
ncbi:MAG: hypothetical protein ACSLFB_06200 [Acidimicrobiales bacterium]